MTGFLLINKPSGITSFGAVARIKSLTGERRVGHTGTLDPMATGVLPVFIGRATALSSFLLDSDKRYSARIKLGVTTDTLDITGRVLSHGHVSVTNDRILSVLSDFTGEQAQVPPMYSALKRGGVRLYELAKRGESVDIPARSITVYSLDQTSPIDADNEFSIDTTVSKGTYIRSLCRDIGEALGCGAVLSALCRTYSAGFGLGQCVALDELTQDNIKDFILPCDAALVHIDSVDVTKKQGVRFSNGGELFADRVGLSGTQCGRIFKVYSQSRFLGLGRLSEDGSSLKVKCVIEQMK